MRTAAVVMAAGRGTRMRSNLPKPLVRLAEKPLVHHLLEAIQGAGVEHSIVVVGHGASRVRSALGPDFHTALQPVLNGTASALEAAQEAGLRRFLYHYHWDLTAGEWAAIAEFCGTSWDSFTSAYHPPDQPL